MTTAKIRFSSDILRRLGEELNPNPDKGILELVKNAYDADATQCTIELINIDQPGGSILVIDNGTGMGTDDIENGWLVLGRSIKSQKVRTELGRIPAGNKGLGRLAALRMGSRVLLTTRPKVEKSNEYNLLIDWDMYEGVDLVDDVILEIEADSRDEQSPFGTDILIENLHTHISRWDVKRLARELILLADPFEDNPSGFNPILIAPEFSDIEELVRNRYFKDAEYHLIGRLDEHGYASASVVDWRGAKIFSADHSDLSISRKHEPYRCPKTDFDLWVFLLHQSAFLGRTSTLGAVRNWLQELGGVHVYQNGLRVSPYGNRGNDWLDMNLARVRSPEERPSTNTSIGRVSTVETEDLLVQKTDRSGFIESETFLEIKAFINDALEWMASRRLEQAEIRREKERAAAPKRTTKAQRELHGAIDNLTSGEERRIIEEVVETYDRSREREVSALNKEIQLYRTLSTAGITAATFAHESSGNPIKVITQSVKAIERRGKKELGEHRFSEKLMKPIRSILNAVESLGVLGIATLKLLDHEKRRLSRIDIHKVIKDVLETFEPFLSGRDVVVDPLLCKGSPYLRGSEAAVESVVTNLLNNSLVAFEKSTTSNRKINIATEIEGSILIIRIIDNGSGIEGIGKKDIWLPGRTTRKNGTGLGLTIVRDTVKDLGGEVDAVEHNEVLGGAEIIIELPIIGA